MAETNPENAATNTYDIAENIRDSQSSWGELRSNGVELQEAASTTFPPNDRYIWNRDGEVLNRDQIDTLVTQNGPLYEFDVQPGETIIVRGKDRNAYVPGFDSSASIASEVDDTGPDGQYVPDGIEFSTGYANLEEGIEQGFALEFIPNDVIQRIYKDGSSVRSKSVEDGDWDFNPFTNQDYEFDLSEFAVKRQEFDLYGAGDCTQFLKLRNKDEESEFKECSTIGIKDDPILNEYNLPTSLRITADSSRTEQYTVRVGPLQFHNRASIEIPTRTKETTIRGATVNSAAIGSSSYQVLGVYRIKDTHKEVASIVNELEVKAGNSDCRVEVREVLPEFLSGLPADSEWVSPGDQNPMETAIEGVEQGDAANVGEYNPGDVTISTFAPEGKTIPRGRQLDVTHAEGGGNAAQAGSETESLQEKISELKYIAVLAQSDSSIRRTTIDFRQRF